MDELIQLPMIMRVQQLTSVRGHIKVVEDLLQDGRVEPSQWAIDHAAEGIKEMLIGYKYPERWKKEYCKMKNDLKT